VKAYWINLDSRTDRAFNSKSQLEVFQIPSVRVPAFSREQIGHLENCENQMYFKGIVACRKSHFQAMELFLESLEDFCLILEDDFKFSSNKNGLNLSELATRMESMNIGLLQIGYTERGYSINRYMSEAIKMLKSQIFYLFGKQHLSSSVAEGFFPGAFAYIVNREIAQELLLHAASNQKVPYDLWLNDLAKSQNQKPYGSRICRLRVSIVSHSDSFESDLRG